MPFDASLVLIDGTVIVISTTAASYVAATATTKVTASGAAVVDLGAAGTGVRGLAAVLIIPALTSATDYLTAVIQTSDEVDFADSVYKKAEAGKFQIAGATMGRILASECTSGAVVVLRFATDKRYVRASITPTAGDGTGTFGYLQILLSPYPFIVL